MRTVSQSILMLLFLYTNIPAQTIDSRIKKVTVYNEGATITRNANCQLRSGLNEIVIKNLPLSIDESSLRISVSQGATLLSEKVHREYFDIQKINTYYDSLLLIIEDSLEVVKIRQEVISGQIDILNINQEIPSSYNSTWDYQDIFKLSQEYGKQMTLLQKSLLQLKIIERGWANKKNALIKQKSIEGNQSKIGESHLRLSLSSESSRSIDIEIDYFVDEAGWSPSYDLRTSDINSQLKIIYKAAVFQNTGEDWNKINLSLSNAEPTADFSLPNLNRYQLDFNNYYNYNTKPKINNNPIYGRVRGFVRDVSNEPLIGANVMIEGTSIGTITDIDGSFSIYVPKGSQFFEVSYTGYNKERVAINQNNLNIKLITSELLDEVVVTGLASRASGVSIRGYSSIEVAQEAIPTQITKSQTSFSYDIDVLYDIPSSGEEQSVIIKTTDVDVQYEYITMPKLSEHAYLTARIKDWQKLDLLYGPANIIIDNRYSGKTYIGEEQINDDYILSLGKDDKIIVRRELKKDFEKKKWTGNNIVETRHWVTSIQNNRTTPVKIKVLDQYPISQNNAIKVELKQHDGAEINKDEGLLTWFTDLEPLSQSFYNNKYEVKYPKNRNLLID